MGCGSTTPNELPTHGGSLRIFASHTARGQLADSAALSALRAQEAAAGLNDLDTYRRFAERVETCRRLAARLSRPSEERRQDGGRLWRRGEGQYAAQFLRVTRNDIPMVADRNPHKQSKFLPGTHIPVVSPEELMRASPDYVLVLPWNLQDEITRQLEGIRAWGGRFVIPVPVVHLLP